jgi:hypothetical protein
MGRNGFYRGGCPSWEQQFQRDYDAQFEERIAEEKCFECGADMDTVGWGEFSHTEEENGRDYWICSNCLMERQQEEEE